MLHDTPRFHGRMTDVEALMWRLEKDRHLSSTFANVMILDRAPDLALLRDRMNRATAVAPRLRQVVRAAPGGFGSPTWADDPDFDVRWHVRHLALPQPGTMRQLQDLVALVASDPFDRARPLWQFTVVDGLLDGRAALIQKLHHTFADGVASIALAMHIFDLERSPANRPQPDADGDLDGDRDARRSTAATNERETTSSDKPDDGDPIAALLSELARVPLAMLRDVRDRVADQSMAPREQAAEMLRALAAELGDSDSARSPLWTSRSLRRRMEVLDAPLDEMRLACTALGGTLNAGFVTVVAHAAGRYHDTLGAPIESLRASMAVSTRTLDSGANAFALARLLVPTAAMPLSERFAAITESLAVVRERDHRTGFETLARLAGLVPTSLLTRIARSQGQSVDVATSNVRGPEVPLFVAGSKVLALHPLGPLGGAAINVTLIGHDRRFDMGVHIDEAAVADPALLLKCLRESVSELCASAPRQTSNPTSETTATVPGPPHDPPHDPPADPPADRPA